MRQHIYAPRLLKNVEGDGERQEQECIQTDMFFRVSHRSPLYSSRDGILPRIFRLPPQCASELSHIL